MTQHLSMKKILLSILILLTTISIAQAQSFEDAVDLYEQEQYSEAIGIFKQIETDEAALFLGKSYLAVGNYPLSRHYLNRAAESTRVSIQAEAEYTAAMTYFREKNYSESLNILKRLQESRSTTGIHVDARRFYNQLLNYLSLSERFDAIQKANSPALRFDLAQSARRLTDEPVYDALVREVIRLEPDTTYHAEITERLKSDSRAFQTVRSFPSAPQGTVYHIGVVLPTFEEDDPDFLIPRNLYYGIMLAAEEFNNRNADRKVRLIFKNSAENADTTAAAITELAWSNRVDAVIGPLFSEPAMRMAELAEEYRVPMFAPLANSDELNLDYNYTYQMNPTFEIHGKQMARYAVQELGLDTLAVITERDALGRSSALSFRKEAERLGATISYFIEDDFAGRGYDLTEYTKVFTSDEELRDSLRYVKSQAVYAPFTGQAAPTLINLFMNELEVHRSNAIVLGSEEWANANLSAYQNRRFEVYHTASTGESADSSAVHYFTEDYQARFNDEPDRFARIGYDTGSFIFQSLETAGNPAYLRRAVQTGMPHDGMAYRIHFDGSRINQSVFVLPLSDRAKNRTE
jgi:ABC-type branched-subunit amino acid transport system substrate-binding protein